MDNVGVVVDDLPAATAFFVELGLELEGEASVERRWDRVVDLDGVRADVAMVRTPDGHSIRQSAGRLASSGGLGLV
jgi:hypothetical protein